jgi:hypothetical protein
MRRLKITLLLLVPVIMLMLFIWSASASADWRWATPKLKKQTVTYHCNSMKCIHDSYVKAKKRYKKRIARIDQRRLQEWKHWTKLYIPQCTWYGESGTSAQFSPIRYTIPNSGGSGAYGKYQMMPGTYHNRAKYHDWSPLDQEIAGHKEYFANGTAPWSNC